MITTERQTAQLSQQALSAASQARQRSDAGSVVLNESIQRMHRLSQGAVESRELIEALNQRSEEIQRVTMVIQSIASQTNLLALNAAIEAARAGEHGRGFAVVADEVRGLAGRTASATQEVGQMVADIQQRTTQVVEQIRQLSADLDSGVQQVELTGEHLDSIARLAVEVESQVGEIAHGAQTNQDQLAGLFEAVERMRGDLAVSDEQTRHLAKAAVQMEGQAETISQRLAQVGLDDYHQRIYDLAREGRSRSRRSLKPTSSGAPSASMICSTGSTNPSRIRCRRVSIPGSTAIPIRSCLMCRSLCCRGMKGWCSPSPARNRVTYRLTTMPSTSH
ncbi:methyl-accepting chemotaxis protein [Pseudomonas viridiflava]|nr:methyl-accepting chemotaxis protein [Pseudomonas viridiflava]